MVKRCISALSRFLISFCLIASSGTPSSAGSAAADLRAEAMRDLSEIDCQADQVRGQIKVLRSAVLRNIEDTKVIVRENNRIVDEAQKQAMESLNELAMEPVQMYLEDAATDGAVEGARKIAANLFKRSVKKVVFVFAEKFQTAVGELGLLNEIIKKEKEVLNLLATSRKLTDANRSIIAASNNMSENARGYDAASDALSTLLKYRETKVDQWASRGIEPDQELLGSACVPAQNSFDGVWAIGEDDDADHIEIRGSKFRYVAIRTEDVVKNCGKPVGTISYSSADHGAGTFKATCNEGSTFVGKIEVSKTKDTVAGAVCLQVSGEGAAPEDIQCSDVQIPFVRVNGN